MVEDKIAEKLEENLVYKKEELAKEIEELNVEPEIEEEFNEEIIEDMSKIENSL